MDLGSIPRYILRGHQHPINSIDFTPDGKLLYSADSQGYLAVWNLTTFRPIYFWKPHRDGITTVKSTKQGVITHGRDNKIHHFSIPSSRRLLLRRFNLNSSSHATSVPSPTNLHSPPSPSSSKRTSTEEEECVPIWSLDVNALNFCQFSYIDLSSPSTTTMREVGKGKGKEREVDVEEGLIAVPSLTKDDYVDVFHVPSQRRLHRSIGMNSFPIGAPKTGSVMSIRLFYREDHNDEKPSDRQTSPSLSTKSTTTASSTPSSSSSLNHIVNGLSPPPPPRRKKNETLHILIGYESGQLCLFRFNPTWNFHEEASTTTTTTTTTRKFHVPKEGKMVEEGEGWELVWDLKSHRDAVMSIVLSRDHRFAYSCGADHFLIKYRVWDTNPQETMLPRSHIVATPSPGKSQVSLRDDDRIVATAGWDGEVGLYSTKSMQPLAVLNHHRQSVSTISFANIILCHPNDHEPSNRLNPPPPLTEMNGIFDKKEEKEEEDEDEMDSVDDDDDSGEEDSNQTRRKAWLASAGQDLKICLWIVYPPSTTTTPSSSSLKSSQ